MLYIYYEYHLTIQYKSFICNRAVGNGQKAFFDTVVEYTEYLQILGELFEWQTQYTNNMVYVLKLERKKVMSSYF